jgi:hypothetical protein
MNIEDFMAITPDLFRSALLQSFCSLHRYYLREAVMTQQVRAKQGEEAEANSELVVNTLMTDDLGIARFFVIPHRFDYFRPIATLPNEEVVVSMLLKMIVCSRIAQLQQNAGLSMSEE